MKNWTSYQILAGWILTVCVVVVENLWRHQWYRISIRIFDWTGCDFHIKGFSFVTTGILMLVFRRIWIRLIAQLVMLLVVLSLEISILSTYATVHRSLWEYCYTAIPVLVILYLIAYRMWILFLRAEQNKNLSA